MIIYQERFHRKIGFSVSQFTLVAVLVPVPVLVPFPFPFPDFRVFHTPEISDPLESSEPFIDCSHHTIVMKIKNTNSGEQDATTVSHVSDSLPKVLPSHCCKIIPRYYSAYLAKAGVHLRVCGCNEEE